MLFQRLDKYKVPQPERNSKTNLLVNRKNQNKRPFFYSFSNQVLKNIKNRSLPDTQNQITLGIF